MNTYLNIGLFIISILLLLVFFVGGSLVLGKLTFNDIKSYVSNTNDVNYAVSRESSGDNWISMLAKKKPLDYSYPNVVFSISFDFNVASNNMVLNIENIDSYKLFCLNEVLKKYNIPYSSRQNLNSVTLSILLNKNNQKNFLNELENYNISYTIGK